MRIKFTLLACLLFASACATSPTISSSIDLFEATQVVLDDMLHDLYPNGYMPGSRKPAVCLPDNSDPSALLLSKLSVPSSYPCSALEGSPPNDPPKISSTGNGAMILSVEEIQRTDTNTVRIIVSTYRGAFNDDGHIYELSRINGAWKITFKRRDWMQ